MRVIGGKYKSRVLAQFAGENVRPTSDRAREALFNMLALKIPNARVLDLFCGSGAIGIESLSRGAKEVVFNDFSKDSVAIVKKNLNALNVKIGEEARVTQYDYAVCLDMQKQPFDFIFIDPPYRLEVGVQAVKEIARRGLLAEGGVVVFERDKPLDEAIDGLFVSSVRKYGKAYLTFLTGEKE